MVHCKRRPFLFLASPFFHPHLELSAPRWNGHVARRTRRPSKPASPQAKIMVTA
jgi:hypothetical protein